MVIILRCETAVCTLAMALALSIAPTFCDREGHVPRQRRVTRCNDRLPLKLATEFLAKKCERHGVYPQPPRFARPKRGHLEYE